MSLWFTARGAGLALLCVLSFSAAFGAIASTRMLSPSSRIVMQYVHRAAALMGLVLLVLHVSAIILDPYAGVGITGAFVPLASGYRAGAIALGTLAMYGFLITVVLGMARGRMASSPRAAKAWRTIHIASYAMWISAVIHSLMAGTDTGAGGWSRTLVYVCIAVVVGSAALRVTRLDQVRVTSTVGTGVLR
jgi:sulfoxide reductase heme-binding subunit YedZ